MSSVSRRFRMLSKPKTLHSSQIYLLQSRPLTEHTENSIPYPDLLLRSFLHFERFLTIDQLFWLTTTAIPQYFSKSFSSPSLRVSDNLRSFFGNFHYLLHLNKNYLTLPPNCQSSRPQNQGQPNPHWSLAATNIGLRFKFNKKNKECPLQD